MIRAIVYDRLGGLLPSIIHIFTDVLYCDHGLSNVHVHRNVMQCTAIFDMRCSAVVFVMTGDHLIT